MRPWIMWNCHGSSKTKACARTSMWRPRASYASLISTRCCMWGSLDSRVPELFSGTGNLCQANFQCVGFETLPGLGRSLQLLSVKISTSLKEPNLNLSMAEAVKYEEINVQERSVNVGLQKLKEVPWTDFAQFGPLLGAYTHIRGSSYEHVWGLYSH